MRTVFVLALTMISFVTLGQDSTHIRHKPRHALKFSPFHLIGFYPSFQLAYEVGISNRLGLQVDAGYILTNYNSTNTDYQNKRGTKLKADIRYYFHSLPNSPDGFYSALETHLNYVNFDRQETTTECFDASCQNMFVRYYSTMVKYRENGGSVKVGYLIFFDNSFLMDVSVGWSLRNIRYYGTGSNTNDVITFFSFEPNEEDRVVITPILGIRIGYRFR